MNNKIRGIIFTFIVCIITSLISTKIFANEPTNNTFTQLNNQGDTFFQQGHFQQAIKSWEKTLTQFSAQENASQTISILTRLAAAYQAIGMHRSVFQTLNKALSIAEQMQDTKYSALVLSQLSDAWLSIGDSKEALLLADNSVSLAKETLAKEIFEPKILASALNSQGNALAIQQHYPEAISAYKESKQFATQSGDLELAVRASLNQLKTAINYSPLNEVIIELDEVWGRIQELPNSHDKATNLISVGKLTLDLWYKDKLLKLQQENARSLLQTESDKLTKLDLQVVEELLQKKRFTKQETQRIISRIYVAFQDAALLAKNLQDARTTSIAYGQLGQLYETEHRYSEALALTRQAIFFAKQSHFPHILYRWYWQQGRIFKAKGDLNQAIAASRLASQTLKPIQQTLDVGYRSSFSTFGEIIRPVHYGLADVLLQKAAITNDSQLQQNLLKEAMNTIEMVKVAELQDYFQDDCVLALQKKATTLDKISSSTAILYPIPLPERLVVIVSIMGKFYQVVISVDADLLNETAWNLRLGLQTRPNNRFLYQARQLYDWMVRPIEAQLTAHQVDTLVVVPEGKLRMIPFSTLHDGKQFLIEKYALALTPGLTLLDPQPIRWEGSKILLVGLSDAVQDYPPLPSVPKELRAIKGITQGIASSHRILNAEYSIESLRNTLKQNEYSVIHLATHGEFDSDPKHTYLLTYGEKMTMDKLQNVIGLGRFRDKPVELLTLSACKTAVGDDRAALGLAGVAVKAGARSAIATLWFVDDEATSIAISDFYRQLLQTPGLSKAKALQNVQKKLIAQDRYWHPSYWAPFLLIGNWL
ncbi:CHAT domain-containing protein [Candidatus Parabeggiatoa sp. HSG14]|uniref:CHAT domain-containing protein n=1 Tax=Candidatus Parabeggiatoa sp. HSG14 TaxID=3055593 RepID=UPI0025A767AD|nr:CHAT domain-containing protein [Thiotrichales bacterium HSG14]